MAEYYLDRSRRLRGVPAEAGGRPAGGFSVARGSGGGAVSLGEPSYFAQLAAASSFHSGSVQHVAHGQDSAYAAGGGVEMQARETLAGHVYTPSRGSRRPGGELLLARESPTLGFSGEDESSESSFEVPTARARHGGGGGGRRARRGSVARGDAARGDGHRHRQHRGRGRDSASMYEAEDPRERYARSRPSSNVSFDVFADDDVFEYEAYDEPPAPRGRAALVRARRPSLAMTPGIDGLAHNPPTPQGSDVPMRRRNLPRGSIPEPIQHGTRLAVGPLDDSELLDDGDPIPVDAPYTHEEDEAYAGPFLRAKTKDQLYQAKALGMRRQASRKFEEDIAVAVGEDASGGGAASSLPSSPLARAPQDAGGGVGSSENSRSIPSPGSDAGSSGGVGRDDKSAHGGADGADASEDDAATTKSENEKDKKKKDASDAQDSEAVAAGDPQDEKHLRVARLVDSKGFTGFMIFATLFALFVDDIEALAAGANTPDMQFICEALLWIKFVVFVAFIAELVMTSYARPVSYFNSFFFWLDIIAILSFIPDMILLIWRYDLFDQASGLAVARVGRTARASARAARIVRVVRVVKLSRFFSKKSASESQAANMLEEASTVAGDYSTRAAMHRDGEKAGRKLVQMTTNQVTFIVLLLFAVTSVLVTETIWEPHAIAGLSVLEQVKLGVGEGANGTQLPGTAYENAAALAAYRNAYGLESEYGTEAPELLWLVIAGDSVYGSEARVAQYQPAYYEILESESGRSRGFFLVQSDVQLQALFNIILMVLIIIVLGVGNFIISRGGNQLVVTAIDRIVEVMRVITQHHVSTGGGEDKEDAASESGDGSTADKTAGLLDMMNKLATRQKDSQKSRLLMQVQTMEMKRMEIELAQFNRYVASGGHTDAPVSFRLSENGQMQQLPQTEDGVDIPLAKRPKFGKDPTVETSFLPDIVRETAEQQERDALAKEWLEKQDAIKAEPLEVTYSYWDGSGHRKTAHVTKGTSVREFLEVVRRHFPTELGKVPADKLLMIKEDLIIGHSWTFYDFMVSKARGKSGPLFNFDVHDDIRLVGDATKEKDESHAAKIVERSWYERNRHIFPASRWEVYDPNKDYGSYTIHGDH